VPNNNDSKVLIVMDGGVIQGIYVNNRNIRIMVIDYDVDYADDEDLKNIPQSEQIDDTYTSIGYADFHPPTPDPIGVNFYFDWLEREEE